MTSAGVDSAAIVKGRPLAVYVGVVLLGFAALYLFTRSSILIGDAGRFAYEASVGDPTHIQFGEPGHFLQVPVIRAVWVGLDSAVPLSSRSLCKQISGTQGRQGAR